MPRIIQADDAATGDLDTELAEASGHTARASYALFLSSFGEHLDRRFRADTVGIAVDVTIQHQIADQQNLLAADGLDELNQLGNQTEDS
jgi:hypothetical protein